MRALWRAVAQELVGLVRYIPKVRRAGTSGETGRHGVLHQGRKASRGENGRFSTKKLVEEFLRLCRDPLHDLRGWVDAQGRARGNGHCVPARPGAGLARHSLVQQVRAGIRAGLKDFTRS